MKLNLIILLTSPFIPRKRETIKYALLSLPLFLIWFIPNIISEIQSQATSTRSMFNYLNTYYHGIHLVRILQVSSDAFIEFGILVILPILKLLKFILFPLFGFVFLWKNIMQGYIQVKESWGNEFTFGAPETYVCYYYRNKIYNEPW